jgi:hypothetical protein
LLIFPTLHGSFLKARVLLGSALKKKRCFICVEMCLGP